jgi:hypothetical protein
LNSLFLWIEGTAFSTWIRESTSVLAFPAILSAHAIGMGLAAGINAVFALHLLGVAPGVPTRELRRFVPVMWVGFWLNVASGLLLLIAYPTKALTNPVFYLKMACIGGAMWLFIVIRRRVFGAPVSPVGTEDSDGGREARRLRLYAAASLACWTGAITAGRLLAYTYTRLLASW